MIIVMARNPVSTISESYCNQCDTWSPESTWEDVIEFDEDGSVTVDSARCPRCGHWHPPYDPPMRNLL
jgi:heterodisulfide reductase subunit A-like polyferredoxin